MSLSWNEIRVRAKQFAADFVDAHYEKGETQTFYNEFFEVFGIKRRQVARYEEQIKKLSGNTGFIDLFWPKHLLVEQKSAGRDLKAAADQAGEYFDAVKDSEKPRFQLLCDFQNWELLDRDTRESWSFTLAELPEKVDLFAFMIGREKRTYQDQDPVNIEASELMGKIHDELEENGYKGNDLERYLVRLLFMLFADDTGIFQPRDHMLDVIENRTKEDGSDLGLWIQQVFEILDTPEDERQKNLDEDLNKFPYVNGELFSERLRTANFNSAMRDTFLEACRFNWSKVSPAIFGSLFQSVMDPAERRKKGAHYTTEKNIMKLIGPLFLDELRDEFAKLKALRREKFSKLEAFRKHLSTLTFLDPACGCGNFLIIAYRELRRLELDCLVELRKQNVGGKDMLGAQSLSDVDVSQFYGIELEEFPARIAEVAMWMMDHIMNVELGDLFGEVYSRIPLKKSPHITHADALAMDWNDLLPAHQCSYIMGNPPFIGSKYQSVEQRQQVRDIAALGGSGGTLDFVCAWFLNAGAYVNQDSTKAKFAFVTTNSIVQGEQVAQLWPLMFDRYKLEIIFGHRTFEWGSEARGKAHVHVVIIGLTRRDMEPAVKRLFSYETIKSEPEETTHKALTAYLFGADDASNRYRVVKEESRPINGLPRLLTGSKPLDGGHFVLSAEEAALVMKEDKVAAKALRPYIGAQEYINGWTRWVLYFADLTPAEIKSSKFLKERLSAVSSWRSDSKSKPTLAIANTPSIYHVTVVPVAPFLAIPNVSSERREYSPIGWVTPPIIPNQKLRVLLDASEVQFAILTSAMHMAWMRAITGRMKSDYMYSVGVVYNTFPWPEMNDKAKEKVGALAQAVLDARAQFPDSTLADLYDPDLMPPVLRKAHTALDKAVDKLYRSKPFESERERVEHLFGLYEKMVAPLEEKAKEKPKRKKKV
ncbi:DNA methyltransferase [Ahrensia sp. 13_GOM-1096m]|uniref:class I SAM-dependent DNA methyltransferase n=1 Tax=Ahrensia sp. 13_GOM-1096m TaxID=1380380 RepID=UPI000479EF99|nr:DNA methyltransferase [Ahrensia sp. 13_GOM-1096m]